MNHWVMALPCLMYLASVGTCSSTLQAGGDTLINITDVAVGAAHIYQYSAVNYPVVITNNFNTSHLSICLSLNILLTLMIVVRLVVHIRNFRKATRSLEGFSGLHDAAATAVAMLIESYALYAVALLLYIVPWAIDNVVVYLFSKVLGTIQVRSVVTFPTLGRGCLIIATHRSSLPI